MGFFSWKTADTQMSIANVYSDRPVRNVYLLQPNGKPPIAEDAYEGYGDFGGKDAYEWLAEQHGLTGREAGIALQYLTVLRHKETDTVYYCALHATAELLKDFGVQARQIKQFGRYDELIVLNDIEASINDHRAAGRLAEESMQHLLKYPLKFSFDKDARYEDLPASESCEHQGYFY